MIGELNKYYDALVHQEIMGKLYGQVLELSWKWNIEVDVLLKELGEIDKALKTEDKQVKVEKK